MTQSARAKGLFNSQQMKVGTKPGDIMFGQHTTEAYFDLCCVFEHLCVSCAQAGVSRLLAASDRLQAVGEFGAAHFGKGRH